MLKSKSFLGLDFGAGSLKAGEFELTEAGGLCLKNFGVLPLGIEGSHDNMREGLLIKALQELSTSRGFTAKNVNACAPGYQVFSKYVKLPPVDTSKVTQIIQYEAQQNVPFPLEEVVWDYQIAGTLPSGELEVFLVAIKSDLVEGLFKVAEGGGYRLQLVDASPAALVNAFRYNYADLEGCSMLLDIGAKTSNALFFEKNKSSSRGINIGANSITQDFALEAKMPFAKAEAFKIAEGFVSLGGAYEEPENPQQAQISKIARQVMTRLHIQVNQTIQFYRGQQGGSAPQRLYLAGGASLMPYTAQFFSEKLNIPVEYFNPLRNVQIDPAVNLEDLARVAHCMGEVVGLGLRNLAQCPIELNLMPKTIRKRQQFNQKKPYFVATVLSTALGLAAMGWFYDSRVVSPKIAAAAQIQEKITPLQQLWDNSISPAMTKIDTLKKEADQISDWTDDRVYWIKIMNELRASLLEAEARTEMKFKDSGLRSGVWVERMMPDVPGADEEVRSEASPSASSRFSGMSASMRKRYGMVAPAAGPEEAPKTPKSTNEISTINLYCSAVNLKKYSPTANRNLIDAFQDSLQSRTNLFVPEETKTGATFTEPDADAVTFNFEFTLKLRRPIKI
jgi:type IV pilus assembly protein PilM